MQVFYTVSQSPASFSIPFTSLFLIIENLGPSSYWNIMWSIAHVHVIIGEEDPNEFLNSRYLYRTPHYFSIGSARYQYSSGTETDSVKKNANHQYRPV